MKKAKLLQDATTILTALGMPRAQQNDRSALTLLALLDLKPGRDTWAGGDNALNQRIFPGLGGKILLGNGRKQELDEFCKNLPSLSNFKRPRKYTFVKEIPKSPVGKILRRKLREGDIDAPHNESEAISQ